MRRQAQTAWREARARQGEALKEDRRKISAELTTNRGFALSGSRFAPGAPASIKLSRHPSSARRGFAQKILGGHRPPLQLGVRNCRGALLSARDVFFVQSREEGNTYFNFTNVE